MLHVITGGSASGKSNYAELLAKRLQGQDGGKLLYLATMFPYRLKADGSVSEEMDPETEARISRHREMRKQRGFCTLERYTQMESVETDCEDILLLECLSNLLANERYLPMGRIQENGTEGIKQAERYLVRPILELAGRCRELLVVTNEIFSDGAAYEEETRYYSSLLGYCNVRLAGAAGSVTEVVCGIPVTWKSAGLPDARFSLVAAKGFNV